MFSGGSLSELPFSTAPGASSGTNTYTFSVSGSVVFSGIVAMIRTRLMAPSGDVTFSGSAAMVRTRLLPVTGSVQFSGSAPITFVPAGSGGGGTIINRISVALSRVVGL